MMIMMKFESKYFFLFNCTFQLTFSSDESVCNSCQKSDDSDQEYAVDEEHLLSYY